MFEENVQRPDAEVDNGLPLFYGLFDEKVEPHDPLDLPQDAFDFIRDMFSDE